jgi:cell shape-determining protein MreC
VRRALLPGQRVAGNITHQLGGAAQQVADLTSETESLQTLRRRIDRLEATNRSLQTALLLQSAVRLNADRAMPSHDGTVAIPTTDSNPLAGTAQASATLPMTTTPALLDWEVIRARVLGLQARAFLAQRGILDAGSQAGLDPEALVLDGANPTHIDLGQAIGIKSGQLALAGRTVIGKLEQVGPWTSTVRPIRSPGYRDLVQVVRRDGDQLHFGPRGLWEGTGQSHGRIRLIAITEAVEPGDLVVAASQQGITDVAALYGTVEEVRRVEGSGHWEISVRPAATAVWPSEVGVLCPRVDPRRIARERSTDTTP